MPFPRAPTGPQDSCVTPASVSPAEAGVQRPTGFLCDPSPRLPCGSRGPEAYWIPAYAGKTLKNAVPSCADRPAGFLCNPCLRHPCESRGPDPVRLHNNARGIRPQAYWIPAYAGKTLKNAVPSCADRPTGFLCDPSPCLPSESRGPDPVRLHNNARGIRAQAHWIPACAERR